MASTTSPETDCAEADGGVVSCAVASGVGELAGPVAGAVVDEEVLAFAGSLEHAEDETAASGTSRRMAIVRVFKGLSSIDGVGAPGATPAEDGRVMRLCSPVWRSAANLFSIPGIRGHETP